MHWRKKTSHHSLTQTTLKTDSVFLLRAENLPCLHSLRRFSPLGISASVDTLDPPTGSCTTLTSIVCHLKCPLCHSSEGCIFVEGAVFEQVMFTGLAEIIRRITSCQTQQLYFVVQNITSPQVAHAGHFQTSVYRGVLHSVYNAGQDSFLCSISLI